MHQQKHISLRRKILDLSLGTAISVIVILLVVSTGITLSIGRVQVKEKGTAKAQLIAQSLDGVVRNVTYNIKAFSTSNSLQTALRQPYASNTYGILKFASSLQSSITSIMDIDTLINDGFIQSTNGWRYDFTSHSVAVEPEMPAFTRVENSFGRILLSITPTHDDGLGKLHIDKLLIDIDTGKTLGMLSCELATERLSESFASAVGADESVFLLSEGTVLSEIDALGLHAAILKDTAFSSATPFVNKKIEGKRYAFFSQPLSNLDATVLYAISYQSLLKQFMMGVLLIVLLCTGLMIAVIFVTRSFSRTITTPLERLSLQAERISDGLFEPILDTSESTEEIEKLTTCLNEMIDSIQKMSSRIYSQQNEKRESDLSLLQAQINPHFLYNCLDNVATLLEQQDYRRGQMMVDGMGTYYRLNLSGGRNIITLQDEIQLTRAYLQLQAIRYPGLFTFSIQIAPSLALYKCIKMLFQPIVENSIRHGFFGRSDGGKITVAVSEEKEHIVCAISDNGCGMDETAIEAISEPEPETDGHHYGLRSIQERLQLAYGAAGGIEIKSRRGDGTWIRIRFPKTI